MCEARAEGFGNIITDSDPSFKVPFGFAGGLYDSDTNLTRFGYRDYDPNVGKWTARDPILFEGGSNNLYSYIDSDPINAFDKNGLAKFKIGGEVISVHKSDVDPWPSQPHGHIYDKNQVIDKDGNIYDSNRKKVNKLNKKQNKEWLNFLKRNNLLMLEFVLPLPDETIKNYMQYGNFDCGKI